MRDPEASEGEGAEKKHSDADRSLDALARDYSKAV